MDLKKAEWEYDCGHGSDNNFSNLPSELQKFAREQAVKAFGSKKPENADTPKKPGS